MYFLIPVVIAQIFNPTTEVEILTGAPTNEGKMLIEIHPSTAETKARNYSK